MLIIMFSVSLYIPKWKESNSWYQRYHITNFCLILVLISTQLNWQVLLLKKWLFSASLCIPKWKGQRVGWISLNRVEFNLFDFDFNMISAELTLIYCLNSIWNNRFK